MASAEGVTLSGIRKDKTDCQRNSGESRKGAEGAKRENAESLRQKDRAQFSSSARFCPCLANCSFLCFFGAVCFQIGPFFVSFSQSLIGYSIKYTKNERFFHHATVS